MPKKFETVQKLQGSQAIQLNVLLNALFETVQKLQGSQAMQVFGHGSYGLRPYRNYKVLKHITQIIEAILSLRPYRNYKVLKRRRETWQNHKV